MIEGIILGGRLQFLESLANSGILHAGNPKAVKRFAASALMIGKPEYQLSFTTGIGGTDQPVYIRTEHEAAQYLKLLPCALRNLILPLVRQYG